MGSVGLGSMGRNHLRVLSTLEGVTLAAVADPDPEQHWLPRSRARARRASRNRSRSSPRRSSMPWSSPLRRRRTCRSPWPPSSAVLPSSSRSRWPRRPRKPAMIVRAASAIGAPPVQVGHIERFNPAVLELGRLLEAGWLSTVYAITSRRAGPFPDRIRDVGVTVDLATHDVDMLSLDRRRAARPRLGRDRPADPRQPRGPPVRPDVASRPARSRCSTSTG